jgi:hypothetical protein
MREIMIKSSHFLLTKVFFENHSKRLKFDHYFYHNHNCVRMNSGQRTHLNCLFRATILTAAILLLHVCAYGQTVYVTNTGAKYHRSSCQYLSKSKIPMQVDSAFEAGYTACSVCKPMANISSGTTEQLVQPESQTKSATAVQCSAKTKAGNRCSRMTKEANGRCWQHQ